MSEGSSAASSVNDPADRLPRVAGDLHDLGLAKPSLSSGNDLSGKLSPSLLGYGLRLTEGARGALKLSRHGHSMRPT